MAEPIVVATLVATSCLRPRHVCTKRLLGLGMTHAATARGLVATFGAAMTMTETIGGLSVLPDRAAEHAADLESAL
jgi:hypothetical protein